MNHLVLGTALAGPYPDTAKSVRFGMGCFWGVERIFWELNTEDFSPIHVTAAAYAGGVTDSPTYREVCSGATGHAEVVQVVWDPNKISFDSLLKEFWENHDPTQGMRQGNDRGSQYRSVIYVDSEGDLAVAEASRDRYQSHLVAAGFGQITTEIKVDKAFHLAEPDHQQYLHTYPDGYCNHGFCQVNY